MGAIVIRTRYNEGTESAEVATSACLSSHWLMKILNFEFQILNLDGKKDFDKRKIYVVICETDIL
jgi:hypothetical protein